jgi:hypothetical protein
MIALPNLLTIPNILLFLPKEIGDEEICVNVIAQGHVPNKILRFNNRGTESCNPLPHPPV